MEDAIAAAPETRKPIDNELYPSPCNIHAGGFAKCANFAAPASR